MFFPASAPPDGDAPGLRALCRSLNTPVVAIEELPAGPASAAIALHCGPDDEPQVTIALRAVRSGQLAFFSADAERANFGSPDVAMDAALSFAESMGFLFDDDEVAAVGDTGPAHAARVWRALISTDPPVESADPAGNELMLEESDVVEPEPRTEPVSAADPVPEPRVAGSAPHESASERTIEIAPAKESTTGPEPVQVEVRNADPLEAERDVLLPADDPEPPEVDLALLLTKFRRASGAPGAPELPVERTDTQIRVMSRF